jgi:hypothetical protein
MPMVVSSPKKQYELPDEGTALAVLADVIDLGKVETAYGPKERVRFKWFVEQTGKDGKPINLIQSFNKSMHEKSTLRKTVKSVLGRDPGDSFDLETLIGSNARLVIEHNEYEGRTFANITAVIKPEKGARLLTVPKDFVRFAKNQSKSGPSAPGSERDSGPDADDSEVEF